MNKMLLCKNILQISTTNMRGAWVTVYEPEWYELFVKSIQQKPKIIQRIINGNTTVTMNYYWEEHSIFGNTPYECIMCNFSITNSYGSKQIRLGDIHKKFSQQYNERIKKMDFTYLKHANILCYAKLVEIALHISRNHIERIKRQYIICEIKNTQLLAIHEQIDTKTQTSWLNIELVLLDEHILRHILRC